MMVFPPQLHPVVVVMFHSVSPRLFLELHSFELRERKSSSGQVVDRSSQGIDARNTIRIYQVYIRYTPW